MPQRTKIQVNFTTLDTPYYSPVPRWEHRIGIYPDARDELLLAHYRDRSDAESQQPSQSLADSLAARRLDEAEKFRLEYRFLAAINAYRDSIKWRPDAEVEKRLKDVVAIHTKLEADRPKLRHLIESGKTDVAFDLAEKYLKTKPNDAVVVGQLGTLHALKGRRSEANKAWQEVTKFGPDDPYGQSMIGWQAFLDGKYEEALSAYATAEAIEPWFDKINYHWGLAYVKLDRWVDAADRFRRTIEINPRHLEAHLALINALKKLEQPNAALPIAIDAVNLSHEKNWDALMLLADLYASRERYQDAADTLVKLAAIARERKPETLSEIRKQEHYWRSLAKKAAK